MSYDPQKISAHTRLAGFLLVLGLLLVLMLFAMAGFADSDLLRYVCLGNGLLLFGLGYMVAGAEARITWFSPELTRLDLLKLGFGALFLPALWRYVWKHFSFKGAFFAILLCASGAFVGWAMRSGK